MKKVSVFLAVGLFVLVTAGITVVFARGMPCHDSGSQNTMMQQTTNNGHHARMMGWMHQMQDRMSNWWTSSPDPRTKSDRDSRATTPDTNPDPDTDGNTTDFAFTIRTVLNNGMAYKGASGEIDGAVNPTLRVRKGEKVTVKLINSMGGTHDLAIPALGAGSKNLTQRGAETTLEFVPEKTGEFDYYCTLPGHRSSGMEGTLIVKPSE